MSTQPTTSFTAAVGRLTWMFLGPMALLLSTIAIVNTGQGWLTGADIAYFVVLGVMLLGRCLEFQSGDPQTATGEPASSTHLHRYLLFVGIGGIGVWVLANLLANHWLAQ